MIARGLLALAVLMSAVTAGAAERHCSKGQYRFDPQIYRCLEVIVYEIRSGKRVARVYHVWEKRRGKR
jgi:hypothetical protein